MGVHILKKKQDDPKATRPLRPSPASPSPAGSRSLFLHAGMLRPLRTPASPRYGRRCLAPSRTSSSLPRSAFRAHCSSSVLVCAGRASVARSACRPRCTFSQRDRISATVGKKADSRRCCLAASATTATGKQARSSAQSSARICNCAGVLPACG